MEQWQDVQAQLTDFRRYLAPHVPKLDICHGLDVMFLDSDWACGVKDGTWQQKGVYLVYDDGGKLLYVGKATDCFYRRVKAQATQINNASSVALIPFPDGYAFLAHALEAFLIARLYPPENKCGTREYIARLPGDPDCG
jgi:hypothetical protein